MKVYKIFAKNFGCNSYILTADDETAVVIDCANSQVYDKCLDYGLTPVAVLLTHGHFDHVGGCSKFDAEGVPIYCGENEKDFIFSEGNKTLFGGVFIPPFKISGVFEDGQVVEFAGIRFKVINTPGHTEGSVCYLTEGCIFTGDTLFCEGAGRWDLPTGNEKKLRISLKRLFSIKGDIKVCPGHEEDTTIAYERANNPFK